jgi:hypothetical protein
VAHELGELASRSFGASERAKAIRRASALPSKDLLDQIRSSERSSAASRPCLQKRCTVVVEVSRAWGLSVDERPSLGVFPDVGLQQDASAVEHPRGSATRRYEPVQVLPFVFCQFDHVLLHGGSDIKPLLTED